MVRAPEPFDDNVRALLRDARQLEPEPAAFQRLWRRANRQPQRARRGIQPRTALATVGAVLLISLSATWLGEVRTLRQTAEVDALLASVRTVESTPLDFLLATPGAELMHQIPQFGATPQPIDLSLFQLQEN